MDRNDAYARRQLAGTDSQAPPRAEPEVSYVELNVTTLSAPRVRRDEGGLSSNYSELNFTKYGPLINEDEDPPIASTPRKLSINAGTDPHKQQSEENIGNRSHRMICLFSLVTSALIAIVVGLSNYVLQMRQSQITSGKNFQILCQLLTSKREQACSQDWIRNKDRCYFISTLKTSYDGAKINCSNADARLLEINSTEEKNVVPKPSVLPFKIYWIGKCVNGKAATSLMYRDNTGTSACGTCDSDGWKNHCNQQHTFIFEKATHLLTDYTENIQDLCQRTVGPT